VEGAAAPAQAVHARYTHLAYRKQPQVAGVAGVAVVAVARELVGFLWAAMQDLGPAPAPAAAGA
jgi:hypothetical protein